MSRVINKESDVSLRIGESCWTDILDEVILYEAKVALCKVKLLFKSSVGIIIVVMDNQEREPFITFDFIWF